MTTLSLSPAAREARQAKLQPSPPAPAPIEAPSKPWVTAGNLLRSTYPVFDQRQPLAIGIHLAIQAAHPELSKKGIRDFLRFHVARKPYRAALIAGAARFGLDGLPCGEVTAEQAALALKQLGGTQ